MRAFTRIALVALIMIMMVPAGAATVLPPADGLVITESSNDFESTWDNLIAALDANANIATVATLDHAAAAAGAGLDLGPNRVVFFGNPALGTPLMQADRRAGLDLPQKIQVYQDGDLVAAAYNPPAYLEARHDVEGVPTLDLIGGALAGLVGTATNIEVDTRVLRLGVISRYPGVGTLDSPNDFETTWSQLLSAIDASPASVAFTVDHAANAASAGLELEPTRLVVFGNPVLGTPLMQAAPTAGIDLALKMLVWEDDSGVHISYTDPAFVARRHRVPGERGFIDGARGAIASFAAAASEEPEPNQ